VVSDDLIECGRVKRFVGSIVVDSIERARSSQNIYLSDRTRQRLLDAAREEAATHECLERLSEAVPPKRMIDSAGIRGATIAVVANLTAILLLLFMPPDLVRDAVVAASSVFGLIGSAVAWVGRRRATRRIL
jgi:hypothetical protein